MQKVLGIVFVFIFTLIIVVISFIAPKCDNELQIVARILFVASIVLAFVIIGKKVKGSRKQLK